jgi:hypothetical protein
MANPYRELKRFEDQRRNNEDNINIGQRIDHKISSLKEDDLTSESDKEQNVLDFGRWFLFCQFCRHGGHASCLDEWFGDLFDKSDGIEDIKDSKLLGEFNNRAVCGVNGCNCYCKLRD